MKKIMFNDKYGLTEAVLKGIKTQTRRVAKGFCQDGVDECWQRYLEFSRYQVGDVVAIAQSYQTICDNANETIEYARKSIDIINTFKEEFVSGKVWGNKMFSKASLMPHHIRIEGVRLEWLNDISNDDCLKEGIEKFVLVDGKQHSESYDVCRYAENPIKEGGFCSPKEAYAKLIDKIGKKGDWKENPLVFVYDFTLID